MPISPRTRAAYLKRMLRRIAKEREALEEKVAQYPPAIARFLCETNERHTRELQAELEALEAKMKEGQN